MNKILIGRKPSNYLGFEVNRSSNKSLNKWLILFLFMPLLISCRPSCKVSPELNTYDCDMCHSREFAACIKKNFPVGSSYLELSKYLTNIGFWKSNLPEDINKQRFYFKWSAKCGRHSFKYSNKNGFAIDRTK